MSSRAAIGIALLLLFAACAPAPSGTPMPTASPEPVATPAEGASVTVDASGRYVCDWVVGCVPFVEFVPREFPWVGDLPAYDPVDPIRLDQESVPDTEGRVFEVGDPRDPVPSLVPGHYRVTAGWLWVNDVASEGPDGPNPWVATGQPGPCVAALEVDETTGEVDVEVEFRENAYCEFDIHAGGGARLDVEMAGTVGCAQFPYSCTAVLSVLPSGTVIDDEWRPPIHDPWWGADALAADQLTLGPVGTVPDLAPGTHRVVVSLLGSSDTPSMAPDGSVLLYLLTRCDLDVEVAPGASQVGVVVTMTPGTLTTGGSCQMALAP